VIRGRLRLLLLVVGSVVCLSACTDSGLGSQPANPTSRLDRPCGTAPSVNAPKGGTTPCFEGTATAPTAGSATRPDNAASRSATTASTRRRSSAVVTTVPSSLPSALEALTRRCGTLPGLTYRLGGTGNTLVGNSTPLPINIAVGTRFVVWAQFAQRHLADFSRDPDTLSEICNVNLPGPGGGPAAIFVAPSPGTWRIATTTNDCPECAALPFTSDVTGRS
jgi:hypothetical protein